MKDKAATRHPAGAEYIVSRETCGGCAWYERMAEYKESIRFCSYYYHTGRHRSGPCAGCAEKRPGTLTGRERRFAGEPFYIDTL